MGEDEIVSVGRRAFGLVNIRARRDAATDAVVNGTLGMGLPSMANRFFKSGEATLAWLGPDEWMLMTADERSAAQVADRLERSFAGHHAAVTEASGNRALFRVAGSGARALIASGCTLDLHPARFGIGQCAQTLLARAGVIMLCHGDQQGFDVLPRRSFAGYLESWFSAARETLDRGAS